MNGFLDVKFESPPFRERTYNIAPFFSNGVGEEESRRILKNLKQSQRVFERRKDWMMYVAMEGRIVDMEDNLYRTCILGNISANAEKQQD